MNRPIGLHLRCNQSLLELLEKAVRLDLPIFQCFLRHPNGKMIDFSKQEIATFRDCCNQYNHLFVHASYRINLADASINRHPALRQELYWAQKLGFTHMILHPGASASYDEGIDALVRSLNSIIKSARDIHILLENVAFTAPSIGGSLEDLQLIRDKLDEPDRLGFCIDTAHAYAFGYDIASNDGQEKYIQLLGQTIGFDSIELIHINDTESTLESRHDIHCRMGSGNIGVEALQEFVLDPQLCQIPLLLELPAIEEVQEEEDLKIVRSWQQL